MIPGVEAILSPKVTLSNGAARVRAKKIQKHSKTFMISDRETNKSLSSVINYSESKHDFHFSDLSILLHI